MAKSVPEPPDTFQRPRRDRVCLNGCMSDVEHRFSSWCQDRKCGTCDHYSSEHRLDRSCRCLVVEAGHDYECRCSGWTDGTE